MRAPIGTMLPIQLASFSDNATFRLQHLSPSGTFSQPGKTTQPPFPSFKYGSTGEVHAKTVPNEKAPMHAEKKRQRNKLDGIFTD
jgi:hypothetical protein